MKKFLTASAFIIFCGLSSITASAQSNLDKIVGNWLLKLEIDGQMRETVFNVEKNDDGVFAVLDFEGQPEQKIEIKEKGDKLFSFMDIPEYGVTIDISYSFVDDDTVNVTVDTGSFVMDAPLTRVKE